MQSSVLILGARGRFGSAAARAFADAGWRVLGHMRPTAKVPDVVAQDRRIEWLAIDLFDTGGLAKAAGRVDVVVHALNPLYTHKAWQAEALPMADAAISLSRALDATLMFTGNVYNFGSNMPQVLQEETPQLAQTVKGKIRIAMEERIRDSGVRAVVIRAGDFFGSGQGTMFDQVIVKDIRKGVFTYPGPRDVTVAWAYLPDLARAFVAVAVQRQRLKSFEVLHFSGHTLTAQQWLEAITPVARAQGWISPTASVRYARLPWAVIRLGALFVPTWRALLEMRYLWNRPHALASKRLTALIGAEPHTPLEHAVVQALADLGKLPAPAPEAESVAG